MRDCVQHCRISPARTRQVSDAAMYIAAHNKCYVVVVVVVESDSTAADVYLKGRNNNMDIAMWVRMISKRKHYLECILIKYL